MTQRRAFLFLFGVTACAGCGAPSPTVDVAPAASADRAAAPPAHEPLAPRQLRVTTHVWSRQTPFFSPSPDGKLALVAGGRTAIRSLGGHDIDRPLAGTRAYRSAFSPSGAQVVTSDEDGPFAHGLVVWSTATGKLSHKIADAFPAARPAMEMEVGFPSEHTVLFHTGCALFRLDLDARAAPERLGASSPCGLVRESVDGKRWFLFEYDAVKPPVRYFYDRVHEIDTATGSLRVLVEGRPVTDVQISPSGGTLCWLDGGARLFCTPTREPKPAPVRLDPVDRYFAIDAADQKVLFADPRDRGERSLHVLDLATGVVGALGVFSPRQTDYYFLDIDHYVTTGFDGGWYYDAAEGWYGKLPIDGELAGAYPVPGSPRRFVLGRETGASRELLMVELQPGG